MLSDDALDNLMQPIIDRQESINNYVIRLICERIKAIGQLSATDLHRLERLLQMGSDVKKINTEIARQTGSQIADIKNMIKVVALSGYLDAKPFYDYRHLSFIPFNKNTPLQNIVKAVQKQTVDQYVNLSKAQAFMMRDKKDNKSFIPTKISDAYFSVIDEAIQAVQSGVFDYQFMMRRTLQQLIDSGIRYVYYETPSGKIYTQRLDTAVRRNLLDGVRAINQGVQDEVGRQFGADGKEISVHEYSAPDHEPIQGHQFSNEEWDRLQNSEDFHDYKGTYFRAIERHIGVLNCRHFAWSVILGVTKPNFSEEELKQNIDRNAKGYTLSTDKHLTMYECTQYQRRLETAIRHAKDGQIAARTAGDEELAKKYQIKVNDLTKKYSAFSKACGLSEKKMKMRVSGYRKISVKN